VAAPGTHAACHVRGEGGVVVWCSGGGRKVEAGTVAGGRQVLWQVVAGGRKGRQAGRIQPNPSNPRVCEPQKRQEAGRRQVWQAGRNCPTQLARIVKWWRNPEPPSGG